MMQAMTQAQRFEIPDETAGAPPVQCPACHGLNSTEAVFCANPDCGKALGEFRYVIEEVAATTNGIDRLADTITQFTGRPHFITVHIAWFVLWVGLNSGIILFAGRFDTYPYELLSLILGIEAILITGFLLISQNRQNRHADKRAELDYEVNVRSYRAISEIKHTLHVLTQRLESMEASLDH